VPEQQQQHQQQQQQHQQQQQQQDEPRLSGHLLHTSSSGSSMGYTWPAVADAVAATRLTSAPHTCPASMSTRMAAAAGSPLLSPPCSRQRPQVQPDLWFPAASHVHSSSWGGVCEGRRNSS
jgi:hypothetical protein